MIIKHHSEFSLEKVLLMSDKEAWSSYQKQERMLLICIKKTDEMEYDILPAVV